MTSLPYDLEHVRSILDSYQLLLGEPLVAPAELCSRGEPPASTQGADLPTMAKWLYEDAPFCLVAHSAEKDPRFTYANHSVLRLFEYPREEFLGLPSRLSAEADRREERERLIREVAAQGYARGYRGLRIAKSGRRFWIEDVTMWNLLNARGEACGQAAMYRGPTVEAGGFEREQT